MNQLLIFNTLTSADELTLPSEISGKFYPSTYSVWQGIISLINNELISHAFIVTNPSVVFDAAFMEVLQDVIDELGNAELDWLIAGGEGLTHDGQVHSATYRYHKPSLQTFSLVSPVVDVAPDLYLINVDNLRKINLDGIVELPNDALEVLLIYLGYVHGFVSVYHPRIMYAIETDRPRNLADMEVAARFIAQQFADDHVPSLAGDIDLTTYRPAQLAHTRPNLSEAVKQTIVRYCDLPSFSIVTRTRFSRLPLLKRMLTSLSRCAADMGIRIECVLSTDVPEIHANWYFNQLKGAFHPLQLQLVVNQESVKASRVMNLLAGIEAASNDYVWIMDDDDFFFSTAFEDLQPAFFLQQHPFILSATDVFEEKWDIQDDNHAVKSSTHKLHTYKAENWRSVFSGVNPIPICGFIVPREFIIERSKQFDFRHDLSEDYTLLLLLLTAPNLPPIVEVTNSVCGVSVRPSSDNVVNTEGRTSWLRDIVWFLRDLQQNTDAVSSGQWQVHIQAGQQDTDKNHQIENNTLKHELQRTQSLLKQVEAERDGLRSLLLAAHERARFRPSQFEQRVTKMMEHFKKLVD